MLRCQPVAAKAATVSFVDPGGIRHSVEVAAESLFEAAALGIARLKRDGWTGTLGPATRLDVEVREPSVLHSVTVRQVQHWSESTAVTPSERLLKNKVKDLLHT